MSCTSCGNKTTETSSTCVKCTPCTPSSVACTPCEPLCTEVPSKELCAGDPGVKGTVGDKGEKGTSILCGIIDPVDGDGYAGDTYLNTVTADFFLKNELCVWELKGNLKGIQGDVGPAGVDGIGISGGDGAPTEDGTVCGQIYLDLTSDAGNTYVWNCDTNLWELSGGSVQGPQGDQGDVGPAGPGATFGAWTDLSVASNSWSNVGASSDYVQNTSGLTMLRGLITRTFSSGGNGALIAILPVGFRPTLRMKFPVYWDFSGGAITSFSDNAYTVVQVEVDGRVTLLKHFGSTTTIDLSPISFYAEQ